MKKFKKQDPNAWIIDAVKGYKPKQYKPPKPRQIKIYALQRKELKNSIFYIGSTKQTLQKRLKQHIDESLKPENNSKKHKGIRTILQADYNIEIILLESFYENDFKKLNQESWWIWEMKNAGIELLNSAEPCAINYVPTPRPEQKQITIEDIETAEWKKSKDFKKSKTYHAQINGIKFYRQGQSKLWFTYAGTKFACAGFVMDNKIVNAIKMLTPGTELNKRMLEEISDS